MLTLSLLPALLGSPASAVEAPTTPATIENDHRLSGVDAMPFQRAAVSAVAVPAGHGTVEFGGALLDGSLFQEDLGYADVGGLVAVSDRFAVYGSARLHQGITDPMLSRQSPRSATLGARVMAVDGRAFRVAPFMGLDTGSDLAGTDNDTGVQLGTAIGVGSGRWTLDTSIPLARVRFTDDPISLEDSLLHTAMNTSLATTVAIDESHALRGGLESGLPYVSYRFATQGISLEPSVGLPFVGLRAGAAL